MTGLCNSLLVAAIAAACTATTAAPARAASGMEVAIQDDGPLVSNTPIRRSKDLKLAARLKVTRIRVNIPWVSVVNHPHSRKKPKHVRYAFNGYDKLYLAARKRGMKLQLTISGFAPAWATGNGQVGDYRIKTKYFTSFVKVIARHFKGHVDRYGIWNEPNYISWLSPMSDAPKIYYRMYTNAYHWIKKIDPRAKVLFGETAPYGQSGRATAPISFIKNVVHYGAITADGYAHHPYDFRHSLYYHYPGSDNATLETLDNLTHALDKLAAEHRMNTPLGQPLDLYLTEYGFMASGPYARGESFRAKYLPRAFQKALDNPRVKEMLQYLIVKPPPRSAFFDTSLASKKGKVGKTFKALQKWAQNAAKHHKIARATPPKSAAASR
jgi:polysaccharide biosynthesis protein PslG